MKKSTLFLFVLLLTSSTYAAKEKALTKTYTDPSLKWSPCPVIFPSGCEMAVLHGDPMKPQTDIFLKTPANYQIPPHTHTSPEHMTLVSGEMRVHYQDQDSVKVTPGTYLYGPAMAPHKATCESKNECMLFISFDSKIDAMKSKNF